MAPQSATSQRGPSGGTVSCERWDPMTAADSGGERRASCSPISSIYNQLLLGTHWTPSFGVVDTVNIRSDMAGPHPGGALATLRGEGQGDLRGLHTPQWVLRPSRRGCLLYRKSQRRPAKLNLDTTAVLCVCMCVCVGMSTCTHTCVYVQACECMCSHVCTWMWRVHVCKSACVCM